MGERLITFAIIDPNGDLWGSTLHESIREAWDDVRELTWANRKWEQLEKEGWKLIQLTWEQTEEKIVKTKDLL